MIYQAQIDHVFPDATPVFGCGCDWSGTVGTVAEIGECSLTPGDPSPAGRCPECESLVYVDTREARAIDEAPAMVAALRDNLDQFEQMERMFSDDAEFIAALEQTRAILSRIDGAGDTLPDAPAPAPIGELVTVRADHLAALVGAAGKYADDLETGLEDGTYDDRADLDAVRAALAVVQGEA